MYKIELHLHTKYSSECGQMSAEDLIAGYKAVGYSGIVVTDHFNRDTFRMLAIDPASGIDRLTPFLEGYRRMKEAGERQGIKIYRGAELRFDGSFNDYLFYNYPDSLLEAGRIDGCSEFGLFTKIILPNVKPLISVLVIYTIRWRWNDFQWPLIVVSKQEMYTLQLGIKNISGFTAVNWNDVMCASLIALIPVAIIFLIFQKQFVEGSVSSGIKG